MSSSYEDSEGSCLQKGSVESNSTTTSKPNSIQTSKDSGTISDDASGDNKEAETSKANTSTRVECHESGAAHLTSMSSEDKPSKDGNSPSSSPETSDKYEGVKKHRVDTNSEGSLSQFLKSTELITTEKIKELTKTNIFEMEGKERVESSSPFLQSKIVVNKPTEQPKAVECSTFRRAASMYVWEDEEWQHLSTGQAIVEDKNFIYKRNAFETILFNIPYKSIEFERGDGCVTFVITNSTSDKRVKKRYKLAFGAGGALCEFLQIVNDDTGCTPPYNWIAAGLPTNKNRTASSLLCHLLKNYWSTLIHIICEHDTSMKVIYCSSSINIDDLKTMPSNYTSSKINTLFKKSEPYFIREFKNISNIEYVNVENYPDFYQIWNDMMNKNTFSYNYKYLESKLLFDEYVEFNKNMAKKINNMCSSNDLLIINDASLYLLPEMVECRAVVRNLDFDDCFVERVPYYERILRSLMKADKFFTSEEGLCAFKKYISSSYQLYETSLGGCHYLPVHVDKESVLDVLNVCSIYRNALNSPRFTVGSEIIDHLKTLTIPKLMPVLMTNVPLLHLEQYIKANPRINIRYIRSSVEIDDKQDRMVQYLKKAYGCTVDVIDNHCYSIIALEMFYCDIFVGYKYAELAKLLRKPYIEDDNDAEKMMEKISQKIGKLEDRNEVFGVDQYIHEFMDLCGYDALQDSENPIDNKIDSYVLELAGWISKHGVGKHKNIRDTSENALPSIAGGLNGLSSGDSSVSGLSANISASFPTSVSIGSQSGPNAPLQAVYRKIVGGENIYYTKITDRRARMSNSNIERRVSSQPESRVGNEPPRKDDCSKSQDASNTLKDHEEEIKVTSQHHEKRSTKAMGTPRRADADVIASEWKKSNRIALLDYDGTLSDIQPLPHMAKPTEDLFDLIRAFNKRSRCIICTGRSKSIVDEWFPRDIEVFAEHGACFRKDGVWEDKKSIDRIDECIEIMEYYQIRTPGTVIEKKSFGCAFHFKQAKGFDVEKLFFLLRRTVGEAVVLGKGVVEVRSSNKYDITKEIKPALVAGDDRVDEDMFEACDGISIRVGKGETKADWFVNTVSEFKDIIRILIE